MKDMGGRRQSAGGRRARIRARVFLRDGGICWLCGNPAGLKANKGDRRYKFTLDHIIPASKGGKFTVANLRVAHALCNLKRGNDDPRFVHMETEARIALQKQSEP